MKKHEFLAKLEKELANLPDQREIIEYYEELINEALSNSQNEEDFIKHLGTPSEIKHKLHRDDTFKANIKAKKNFSATQTFSVVTKVLSFALYLFVIVMLAVFATGLVATGLFSIFTSIYHLISDTMTNSAQLYYVFHIIFQITLVIFGILTFVYIFKYSKRQFEKLQLLVSDKLSKGEVKQ